MFNFAAGLFERGMLPIVLGATTYGTAPLTGYGAPSYDHAIPCNGNGLVQKVDVYNSAVTTAKYNAKRKEFAAQGISTAETWVFHGTPSTANVHSIMTEGFKVTYIIMHNTSSVSIS
jgi:hypothetical protein